MCDTLGSAQWQHLLLLLSDVNPYFTHTYIIFTRGRNTVWPVDQTLIGTIKEDSIYFQIYFHFT